MSVADVALLVIAIDLTALVVVGLVYAGRLASLLETVERSSRRIEAIADRVDGVLENLAGVGEEAKHVVKDVRVISREAGAVVQVLGVSKRARATLVGAKAAVDAFRRHADNGRT